MIVLGGAGNFGARIVRALRGDPTIDLLVAGRGLVSVPGAEDVPGAVVDIGAPDFAQQLRSLSPELVIHCVGPFQGQGYGVAKAALAAGAHYLDLADGRHPFPVARWAVSLNRFAGMFDAGAGEKGGMQVSVVGDRSDGGGRVRRAWQLTAPAMDGPEIPCMAAILLSRRLARGEVFKSGALPCMGFLTLSEFAPEFARWRSTTRMEEVAA